MGLELIPVGANEAWLVAVLPLGAFVLLALGFHRVRPLAAAVSVLAIGAALIAALGVLGELLAEGERSFHWTWLASGDDVRFRIGYTVSPLSTLMLVLVTSVSLAVQVYSLEYMKGEPRLGWYYAAHSLFAASMLGLVLTGSLLLLYITWELVGLCSYLLIGFWYERRSAAEAAKKAFITTRLGDVGLLIGVIVLFLETGTFDISGVLAQVPQMSQGTAALAAFLLFLGAMGKSAQMPFHVWLPDAMEGPTPVSALIHAATMVAAGVFLVARMYTLFLAAPAVLWFVAVIGGTTALMAGVLALAEVDFKRILAYSTVSQLGLMMLALGAAGLAGEREPVAGVFHLVSHGYFKALLFLTAGVALHAIGRHAATIYQVRGLARRAPWTAIALGVGSLAMAGLPPFSGFFSKEGVLAAPLEVGGVGGWLLFAVALGASFLSALYMARLAMVVALGTPEGEARHLHDPPPAMAAPVAVLSVLALALGLALATVWDIGPFLNSRAYHLDLALGATSVATALAAVGLGWAIYGRATVAPPRLRAALGPLPRWAEERFYFDRLYQAFVDRVALAGARLVALFDRRVVNDAGVNGTGALAPVTGAALRLLQTGRVYNYALAFAVGVVVLASVALFTRVP